MDDLSLELAQPMSLLDASTDPIRVIVPANFRVDPGNPSSDGKSHWDRLIEAHQPRWSEIIAIVNIGKGSIPDGAALIEGGPFIRFDPIITKTRYDEVLGSAAEAGVGLVGYVDTNRGLRPIDHAKNDIDEWIKSWPKVTGIFLDQQAVGTPEAPNAAATALSYYRELRQHVLQVFQAHREQLGIRELDLAKPLVVTNPGNVGSEPEDLESYLSDGQDRPVADIMLIREDFASEFENYTPPEFTANIHANRFAMLLHDAPELRHIDVAVNQKRIRNVFVTDGDKLWNRLPTYWDAEIEMVRSLNAPTG